MPGLLGVNRVRPSARLPLATLKTHDKPVSASTFAAWGKEQS